MFELIGSRLMSIVGMVAIVGLCLILSSNRGRIKWSTVIWGLGLQILFGLLILKTDPDTIFSVSQSLFDGIYKYADKGAGFLFGSLAENQDFVILSMGSVIIFVSCLMAVLNYARILPAIVYGLARLMQRTLKTSGAETLGSALFILMGIEGLSGLRDQLAKMTRSELFTIMTCFMATIAGSVMAVYVSVFGANAGHILAASVMSAPAALALSKILEPETLTPETIGNVPWEVLVPEDNGLFEAATNGAVDGLKLAAVIGAILLAFVSLISMLDAILGLAGTSFTGVGGYVFAPAAFLMGIPYEDCINAGKLLALKTVFNEWLAYSSMKDMALAGEIGARSQMILTYALCSFANFGSLGILIGGLSSLAPMRREEVASMGLKAMLGGLLAGFLTAAVAGALVSGS